MPGERPRETAALPAGEVPAECKDRLAAIDLEGMEELLGRNLRAVMAAMRAS